MTIGESIRQARKKAGLTQAELANKLGISAAGIAQWENNLRNPKIETIKKIADALEMDFVDLISKADYFEIESGNLLSCCESTQKYLALQQEYQEIMKSGISENNIEHLKRIKEKFDDMAYDLYDTELLANFHRLQDADKEKVTSYCQWLADTAQNTTKNTQDTAGPAADDAATDDPKE